MAKTKTRKPPQFIPCSLRALTGPDLLKARDVAVAHNPANAVNVEAMVAGNKVPVKALLQVLDPMKIAVLTAKYWGKGGVDLGVSFLDSPNAATKAKILAYANKWYKRCNISFRESAQGQVRITRGNTGYWSYLGTDITLIGSGEPTMNLQGFTENTPSDAEYDRVVTHEFGHTCGCPHEHSRAEIINLLDPRKTVKFFKDAHGWDAATTRQQVLTPVEESSLLGGPTEEDSIMCYWFPGECTKNGKPIAGGKMITDGDFAWMEKLYPKAAPPPGADEGAVLVNLATRVVTAPAGWVMRTD